jgi:hypothetical protein
MNEMDSTSRQQKIKPGVCFPWEQRREELPQIQGNEDLLRKVWEDTDTLGYIYIWHCLLSF